MTMRSSEPGYLRPHELAERWLGVVTRSTLDNWRTKRQNRGPRFVKIGGRVLYPVAEVEAYEARNLRGIPNHPPTNPKP
jgi:predicted DNA-binding transcriptional regulator AlpA